LLAKHILAMANKSGGAIVFGVEEIEANKFSSCGLLKSFDITDIDKKLASYIPKKVERNIIPIHFKGETQPELEDKIFLVVIVGHDSIHIPFLSLKSGDNIKRDTIYTRRNRASEPINHDELQEILNSRIDTEYSTTNERKLIEHLEELKELYSRIPKTIKEVVSHKPPSRPYGILGFQAEDMKMMFGETEYKTLPNPEYPKESYESFVSKIIEIKKDVIIKLIAKA
jgi:predicted HTH transcriptional regulator